jgi:hypothetical protein
MAAGAGQVRRHLFTREAVDRALALIAIQPYGNRAKQYVGAKAMHQKQDSDSESKYRRRPSSRFLRCVPWYPFRNVQGCGNGTIGACDKAQGSF